MAQLHARGELELGTDFVNESFIGTPFTGRLLEETTVGDRPAVVPTVTGRAWITGMGQYLLDPDRPLPRRLHPLTRHRWSLVFQSVGTLPPGTGWSSGRGRAGPGRGRRSSSDSP